jgi:MSHA biogenesis protein MshL
MLEAKIIEVELSDGFSSGIDWSYTGSKGTVGQTSGYAGNPLLSNTTGLPTLPQAVAGLVDGLAVPSAGGGTLGLALATKGFQAVMGFLESQGDLQVLSSPRVATLNNQKAVLKVGTDEYFVTNVAGGSVASGTDGTTTLPTLTLTPFFSGIALDVTPQIDEHDVVTLHLRPSVTSVTEKTKQIDLGTIGNYRLPLASSSVNETDTVVRVPDGHIVAIGGLMQSQSQRRSAGLPGSGDNAVTRTLFGNQADSGRKKELVVLIRPTILRNADDWARSTAQAMAGLEDGPRRTIRLDGTARQP